MRDSFRSRLQRLETSRAVTGTPNLILSTCPMPRDPPTAGVIEQWLDAGLAHVAFSGRAILYHGGETGPIDEQQWRRQYCTTQ